MLVSYCLFYKSIYKQIVVTKNQNRIVGSKLRKKHKDKKSEVVREGFSQVFYHFLGKTLF